MHQAGHGGGGVEHVRQALQVGARDRYPGRSPLPLAVELVVVEDLDLVCLALHLAHVLDHVADQVDLDAAADLPARRPIVDLGVAAQRVEQASIHGYASRQRVRRCGPPELTGTRSFHPLPQLPATRWKSSDTIDTSPSSSGT